MAVPPAPVRVPSQRPLTPSVESVMSVTNGKGDNEMILEAVHRSPGLCLTAEENPRKPQLGDRLMKEKLRLGTAETTEWFLLISHAKRYTTDVIPQLIVQNFLKEVTNKRNKIQLIGCNLGIFSNIYHVATPVYRI